MVHATTLNIISLWRQKMLEEGKRIAMRGCQEKHSKLQVQFLCRLRSVPSPLIRVSRDIWFSPLFLVQWGRHPYKWRIPYTYKCFFFLVDVSYKRETSTQFSELHWCLLFLKNNQPKIICQVDIFLGSIVCSLQRFLKVFI